MPKGQIVPKAFHATGKELQAEVLRVTGRKYNPGYLLNIQNGNVMNSKLDGVVSKYRARRQRQMEAKAA